MKIALPFLSKRPALRAGKHYLRFTIAIESQFVAITMHRLIHEQLRDPTLVEEGKTDLLLLEGEMDE